MKVNIPINGTDIVVLIILAVIIALAIRVFIGFWKKPDKPVSELNPNDKFASGSKIELTVDGMQCGMCEIHVKDAVRKAIPDVKKLTANHTKGKADFILPEAMTRKELEDKLHKTIDPDGYRLIAVESR